jgi:hypothetical protein
MAHDESEISPMYAIAIGLPPLRMLRPSATAARWFAAALTALALLFGLLISSHDPEGCHPEKQTPALRDFRIAQTLSPTTINPFNHCAGGPQFSVGDY